MEPNAPSEQGKKSNRFLILLLIVLIVLMGGVLAAVLLNRGGGNAVPDSGGTPSAAVGGARIGYAESAVILEQDSLQKAVDEMYEKVKDGNVALDYKNSAVSSDGQTFACYINNSERNKYDMFIGIYADKAYTDELYVSELLRPGTGFDQITLNRSLDKGTHTVYVAYNLVDEEDGEQVIKGQLVVTMEFTVQDAAET